MWNKILLLSFIFSISCTSTKNPTPPTDMHTSKNALDWVGMYSGTIPCADCEGINIFLQLNQDLTYHYETTYLGKPDGSSTKKGELKWNEEENGVILLMDGKESMEHQFAVRENYLLMLDRSGQVIEGDLANHYRLDKMSNSMMRLHDIWALEAINEEEIIIQDFTRQPDLEINLTTQRIMGNDGCNNLMGAINKVNEQELVFSKLAGTRMACKQKGDSEAIQKYLSAVRKYELENLHLNLLNSEGKEILRFRKVD